MAKDIEFSSEKIKEIGEIMKERALDEDGIKRWRETPVPSSAGYTHDQSILSAIKPEYRKVFLHLLRRD